MVFSSKESARLSCWMTIVLVLTYLCVADTVDDWGHAELQSRCTKLGSCKSVNLKTQDSAEDSTDEDSSQTWGGGGKMQAQKRCAGLTLQMPGQGQSSGACRIAPTSIYNVYTETTGEVEDRMKSQESEIRTPLGSFSGVATFDSDRRRAKYGPHVD